MRALHVIPSMAPQFGGPAAVMPLIAAALDAQGVKVDVATITGPDETPGTATPDWEEHAGFRLRSFDRDLRAYRISWSLQRWLRTASRDYDVVHVHGVFTFSSRAACLAARNTSVPYIVRPFGVLNRWGMEKRRPLLKKLFFRIVEKPLLDKAGAIHYTSTMEASDAARLGIASRAVVIPLPVDLSDMARPGSKDEFCRRFPASGDGPVVLFVSRIDEKKGLDLLIAAFDLVRRNHPAAKLVIAGDGPPALRQSLEEQIRQCGISNRVVWTGFIGSETRRSALAAADVFCLPSRSENFGMALLEAMAAGRACVTSDQVALGVDAAGAGAARMAPCDPGKLAEALDELLNDPDARRRLGAKASTYAAEHHSPASIGLQLKNLYSGLSGKTNG